MFSLDYIQSEILEYLDDIVFPGQEVVEQAYEDVEERVLNASGSINPYVAFTFGDLQQWGATSFAGPRGDDYSLPLYLLCVAPKPELARGLSNRAVDRFLGAKFEWAGQVRKRAGGALYPMKKSDGAVEAYVAPVSFGLLVSLATIPAP